MGKYVTDTGLARKTLQEVRLEIENSLKQVFGPSFETSVDSPNGLLISQLALAISSQWDLAQEVFVSRDPSQASGVALDWAAALSMIYRKPATPCRVSAVLYTDLGQAAIPSGSLALRTRGNLAFTLDDPTTINRSSCDELLIMDSGSARGTTYVFHFTFGDVTLTNDSLADNLVVLMSLVVAKGATAELSDRGLRIYRADGSPVGINGPLPSDFDVWAGSNGGFTAGSSGAQTCLEGELDSVSSPVTGWVSVYNYQEGVLGTDLEGDTALRLRREQASRSIKARGTDPSVAAHLVEDVPGVTSAVVTSNRRNATDETGRPPKSFEALVVGGDDTAVAQCIHQNQASGIQSYGNTSIPITDDNGDEQIISFSRPVPWYLWIKVSYSAYDEEALSTEGEIVQAIMDWATREYTVGKDVIPDRIKGGLYRGTTGIGSSTIQVAVTRTATATPHYSSGPITIARGEYAVPDSSRISIVREDG